MHVDVRAGLAPWMRMALAAVVWLAGTGLVAASATADVQTVVVVATAAVREAFGGEADVTLSQPVLSLTSDDALVTRAVPEPASRTAGPVRFVLYASVDGAERRVGRLTARVDVAARHVRANQPVAARVAITEHAVEVVRGDIGRQALNVLPEIGAVTGAITRKALVAGEIVTQVVLVARSLVSSGEEVITVARIGALEVRGRAIAAQSGGLGETVIVVNPDSRKRLRGRIVGSAVVEVLHGS